MVYVKNQILVKYFTTFSMKTYRKEGSAYTDLFKMKMKKLFLGSRRELALDRINLHLEYLYKSIGFKIPTEALAPFMDSLLGEAYLVQDSEYEGHMQLFLAKVDAFAKKDKKFEMEPGFPRWIFTSALLLMFEKQYILPQDVYMSIGRLALLIHELKWKHDRKMELKKKGSKNATKNTKKKVKK